MNNLVTITELTNQQFFERYAKPGRIGLVGGVTLIEQAIKMAERHLDEQKRWSLWSHAMVFEGTRADGHQWIIESDLDIHHKHIRLGVQENRVAKYHDEATFPNLAILDFNLDDAQVAALLREALEIVSTRATYSLRELVGTAVALHNPWFRSRKNLLARKTSMYCSGFVQHIFGKAGIELAPGVHPSHGTPEDISRTPLPHTTYLLQREP